MTAYPAAPNPAAVTALDDLNAAIGRAAGLTPCRTGESRWWCSDDDRDRLAAAELCRRECPTSVRDPCRRYADTAQETHGVWAGRDLTPRRAHRTDQQRPRTRRATNPR